MQLRNCQINKQADGYNGLPTSNRILLLKIQFLIVKRKTNQNSEDICLLPYSAKILKIPNIGWMLP